MRAMKRAVVFFVWGRDFVEEAARCVRTSSAMPSYPRLLITDFETDLAGLDDCFDRIIRTLFQSEGLLRKTELYDLLPQEFDSFLFLDSDTLVLEEVALGFEKAERFHIAAAPAPHYSLDWFWGFDEVMRRESVPLRGQLQYNTGVLFFRRSEVSMAVFRRWRTLALKHQAIFKNDQPFFTLAMEIEGVNPYTLTASYNYRGFGDAISGIVRIWHSHGAVPPDINTFKKAWPPRRALPGKVLGPEVLEKAAEE